MISTPTVSPPLLRPARPADAGALSSLLAELGHPLDPGLVADRLEAIARAGELHGAFVAAVDEEVVGVVTAFATPVLHRPDPVGRVSVLVVRSGLSGQGIGSALLAHAERFLARLGCTRVELTSAVHRTAAHGFYQRRGYEQQGLRFVRSLPAPAPS